MKSKAVVFILLAFALLVAGLIADNRDRLIVYASDFDEVIARESVHVNKVDTEFAQALSGKIYLQVEENGEAWYIYPENVKRYYLGRPNDAFEVMREQGLGITTFDLEQIPEPSFSFSGQFNQELALRLSGMILLQVEDNGEAWYVNPDDLKRYFLGRPADAFELMRTLGVGISNDDLRKVALGQSGSVLSEQGEVTGFSVQDAFISDVSTSVSSGEITIRSNGLPDHDTGDFPNSGNPNSISEQDIIKTFTLTPTLAPSITPSAGIEFGIALNGILFEPLTAEYWNNDPSSGWNLEWSTNPLGFDFNNAHVQPDGTYHYHGSPTSLLSMVNGKAQTLIGFAADGFPIYIENLKSSYRIKSGIRPDGPGGTYDGTYVQDYEYIDGLGDLDECNGISGTTPEYPNGIYYYVVTEEFPSIGRCHSGIPNDSFRKGPGIGQGPGSGGPPGGQGPGLPPPR